MKPPEASAGRAASDVPVLVTGGSGALGGGVVSALLARGEKVRILVRRVPAEPRSGVEVALGDLGDPEAVERAVRGARTVIHAGSAMKGGWAEHHAGTVLGTRHVLDACMKHGVHKLVHVSSMSVVDLAGGPAASTIDERTAFEPHAEDRGAYTRAKLMAEQAVAECVRDRGVPAVILRPGQIFGGGIPLLTAAVARRVGKLWVVLGDGRQPLPLVYIDDVVRSILLAADGPLHQGEVIQIVDPEVLVQDDVLRLAAGDDARIVHVPRRLLLGLARSSEIALGVLDRKSPFSVYRLRSALATHRFESLNAKALLGWEAEIGVTEGIRRVLARDAAKPRNR